MPEQIYRRRRAAAIGGAVVVLIIVIVLLATQCGGPETPVEGAVSTATGQSTATTEKSSTTTSTSPATSTTDAAPTTQDEAAAIAQGQCPDSAIGITVASDKPNYTVGQQPMFITTITNIGNVPCTRDLSDALSPNVVTTLDGQTRIWSSVDCFPGGDSRIVTLEPGKQERTQIPWSGTSSSEGCTAPREPVGPGAYTITAFSSGKASAPQTFNIG